MTRYLMIPLTLIRDEMIYDLGSSTLWWGLTAVAVVVHQDDLLEQVSRCVIDHAVYGAQDHRQSFIHKDKHHRDLRQVFRIRQLFTPAHTHTNIHKAENKEID